MDRGLGLGNGTASDQPGGPERILLLFPDSDCRALPRGRGSLRLEVCASAGAPGWEERFWAGGEKAEVVVGGCVCLPGRCPSRRCEFMRYLIFGRKT